MQVTWYFRVSSLVARYNFTENIHNTDFHLLLDGPYILFQPQIHSFCGSLILKIICGHLHNVLPHSPTSVPDVFERCSRDGFFLLGWWRQQLFFVLKDLGGNAKPRQGMGEGGLGTLRAESRLVVGLSSILKDIAEIKPLRGNWSREEQLGWPLNTLGCTWGLSL